ncbi:NAD-dependent succinate-semialdehyde dehydrogenase [Parvibaculum sp.]|jgi:succinate-semialdehyde dehydrogenase/glutarate-semialdehyde dehydrogenase|uniref:NAD-dependent succinate-semialdehyde dehydrogenase n=1 Tax=Parvibaculum sp. TaxID=2024848 RepID=UPI001B0587F7|nr:NAD-dependent succinate-semialdehyde dehydrogenase [Parvibaculum sp.]MBO6635301.1 NAD-dependent succinate-semialdehyde dehydrogenase [Parvibaculum sp.]MBO6678783.1 NAD-dependent succinate-semialdehyde dehydrogenase [Parvibaculum sp.]MBO6684865.1 NAD-dependent succinate-semialdehyde dehydrogenase [Parvibaculum sp.]MBO6903929.1 NAD-dependent succinate-semialdehyde dehydrogenase [Parvibaculum sp.]
MTLASRLKDKTLLKSLCFVDGKWVGGEAAQIDVVDPASGETIATVPSFGAEETREALVAAERAQKEWAARPAKERGSIMRRWFDLMMENQDDLGAILTAEQGKPLAEAKGEIAYAAAFIEFYAEEAKRVYGSVVPAPTNDRRIVVLKQPIGVCAAITPWNFPAAMITRKAAPALAAGCSMVVKPATMTPLSAFALAELAQRAGIPDGVLSVVTGKAGAIGGEMTSSPIVRKVTFTGSTEIGKELMRQSASTVKKVALELGGNAPFLVFDDADIDAAVEGAVASKYRNTGQTCICTNRFIVQAGVYDEFVEKLTKKVAALKVGSGFEDGVAQGPLIDMAAVEKIEEHVADAVSGGAKILTGGKRHAKGGTFFEPTVIADMKPGMKAATEETFGPLAPVFRFETDDEAIAMANDTPFGLASYFYSRDIGRVWRVAEALEAGLVGVNAGLISTELAPFGGYKESGLGREGGPWGIEEFLEVKYVAMAGL